MRNAIYSLIIVFLAACNLASEPEADEITPEVNTTPTIGVVFQLNGTPIRGDPTRLPLPDVVNALATPITPISSSNTTPLPAGQCAVYTTYAGPDASFKLSLRAEPSRESTQVFRVANFAPVYQIAGTQEVEAGGYHWLNVIYLEGGTRYEGWMARDGYMRNGQRDLTTATLRTAGQSQPCP